MSTKNMIHSRRKPISVIGSSFFARSCLQPRKDYAYFDIIKHTLRNKVGKSIWTENRKCSIYYLFVRLTFSFSSSFSFHYPSHTRLIMRLDITRQIITIYHYIHQNSMLYEIAGKSAVESHCNLG